MAVVDQNAMFRAGLARGTTGRNPKVERQLAREERLINFGYDIIGSVAQEAIKDGFEGIKKFRNAKESQTAAMNLALDKMPKENVGLQDDVRLIYDNYRKAARRSRLTFGKKRAEAKAEMSRYMDQMASFNSTLEAYASHVPKSQGTLAVVSGVAGENNKGGSVNMSASAYGDQIRNTTEQANGDLGMLLNWDHEEGVMKIMRGGKWAEDKNGKRAYMNMGIEENKELKKRYKEYEKDFKQKTDIERDEVDLTLTDQDFLNQDVKWQKDAPKKLDYPEWAQTQNTKTLRNVKYSDLKFAPPEDRTFMNDHLAAKKLYGKNGYTDGSWYDKETEKEEVYQKIDSYNNNTFKDFFFGGPGFNYSNRRLSTGSLAYKILISRNTNHDFSSGIGVDDGDNTNNLIPPDSENSTAESNTRWEGALTTLKMQDMSSGSNYRRFAQKNLWTELEGIHNAAGKAYRRDNPKDPGGGDGDVYVSLWGNQVLAPQTGGERSDFATVQNIANDQQTVIVGNTKYERVNGAGFDYRAIEDNSAGIWKSIPPKQRTTTNKETLIQSVSPIYGKVPNGYFGESTYKAPSTTKVFDPTKGQVTIAQMKDVLSTSGGPYDANASDEQITEMYKKYVKSLMPQNQ